MTGPEPPQAPQAKDPGLRGERPSSARNWCSLCAKLAMAGGRTVGLSVSCTKRGDCGGEKTGQDGKGETMGGVYRTEVEWRL